MLGGIELLLRGLEIDVMNLAVNNRLEEGSYEWAKRVFTNKEWLYENRITLKDAINNASPDSEASIFKKLIEAPQPSGIEDSRVLVEALIKLWALWYRKYYEQFEISFYIEHRESAWLQFRSYIKERQAENINTTGLVLSKK
jgi:hypothetical protein